jgi:hypothetical protein
LGKMASFVRYSVLVTIEFLSSMTVDVPDHIPVRDCDVMQELAVRSPPALPPPPPPPPQALTRRVKTVAMRVVRI